MRSNVFILPGFGNSGESHWQSLWERAYPDFIRVQQRDWNNPVCEAWVNALEKALQKRASEPILVAHSMACLVVAHWANRVAHLPIKGALLVAPPDSTDLQFPSSAVGFEETPLKPFDFPSIVVASTNDVYASIAFSQKLATAWGSTFVNVGEKGHINSQSGLGFWDEGFALLKRWL